MGEVITIIEVDGVKIAKVDFANLQEAEYLQAIETAKKFLMKRPKGELLPTITDASNTYITDPIKAALQKVKEDMDEYHKGYDHKNIRATIGIGGLKKVIANVIAKDVRFFNTFKEAVRWAVAEAKKA